MYHMHQIRDVGRSENLWVLGLNLVGIICLYTVEVGLNTLPKSGFPLPPAPPGSDTPASSCLTVPRPVAQKKKPPTTSHHDIIVKKMNTFLIHPQILITYSKHTTYCIEDRANYVKIHIHKASTVLNYCN